MITWYYPLVVQQKDPGPFPIPRNSSTLFQGGCSGTRLVLFVARLSLFLRWPTRQVMRYVFCRFFLFAAIFSTCSTPPPGGSLSLCSQGMRRRQVILPDPTGGGSIDVPWSLISPPVQNLKRAVIHPVPPFSELGWTCQLAASEYSPSTESFRTRLTRRRRNKHIIRI